MENMPVKTLDQINNEKAAQARLIAIQLVASIDNLKLLVKNKKYDACTDNISEIRKMVREMGKHLKEIRENIEPQAQV